MNLSKSAKANISYIKAGGRGNFYGAKLTCDEIRTVLEGSGKCKIYIHLLESDTSSYPPALIGWLYFDCSDGKVCTGPPW
jgi:hypothetical protein